MHGLALDELADPFRKAKGCDPNSGRNLAVQDKAKGKGAGLGAPGGIQKSDPSAKPEHASALALALGL